MDSSLPAVMFIVNPNSRGGQTGKLWGKYKKEIIKSLPNPWDFKLADEMGKGITFTKQAIEDGFTTIVGVGGEGTINEVVNGSYIGNVKCKIGFIRSGTSNDFLSQQVYNWPQSIPDQLEAIHNGHYWLAPLTKVDADYTRYSLNLVDTGISAMVSYESTIKRRFNWIKSGIRYNILALLNLYKWNNIPATIKIDGSMFEGDLTMLVSGFSNQLGNYLALPQADLYRDKMAYLLVRNFSRLKILRFMMKIKKGNHNDSIDGIDMGYASKIQIEAEEPVMFEVDGEPFSYNSTKIDITALPNSIPIIAHPHVINNNKINLNPQKIELKNIPQTKY